jgi:hypothetical protein
VKLIARLRRVCSSGRTAAECFNQHMDRHGPSPAVGAPKPRRYLTSVVDAAEKSAAGGSSSTAANEAKVGAPSFHCSTDRNLLSTGTTAQSTNSYPSFGTFRRESW